MLKTCNSANIAGNSAKTASDSAKRTINSAKNHHNSAKWKNYTIIHRENLSIL